MKILIIGAGISGLAAAYRLQQRLPAAEITVLEQQSRPGGTVWTERHAGFQIEIGANGFLDTKPTTVDLCRDLGLGDRLVSASEAAGKNRYLLIDGRLRPLPSGLGSFLVSDLLSWRAKVSLFWERFRQQRQDDSDESIDAFVRRRAGPEAMVLADALVTGIYAGDPQRLSVAACFPRLVEFERLHGSVLKGMAHAARQRRYTAHQRGESDARPAMRSFREGLRLLIETLSEKLARPPLLGTPARRVRPQDGTPRWVVEGERHRVWQADAVVLTCPAYRQAALLADLDHELADDIGTIPYNRIAVVGLGYCRADVPHNLNGFGYLVPQREGRNLLGVQWCSSIFPERAPPGKVLLRAMCGGWQCPEVAAWDDKQLLDAMRRELRLALGITAAPVWHHIIRWERAIPQYHVGHLEGLARIEKRVARYPGLFLGGNAYRGVALNDCTEQAIVLADRMRDYFLSLGTSRQEERGGG
jgi:oxygen-dependent protoporphyrinogen oxidase